MLATSVYSSGWQSNYSFSCFWHADWPAQVVASNPRILLAGWHFQHLFKTIKVWQLPVLPSVGSLVRLRQFQNVKLPLGYGGESPFVSIHNWDIGCESPRLTLPFLAGNHHIFNSVNFYLSKLSEQSQLSSLGQFLFGKAVRTVTAIINLQVSSFISRTTDKRQISRTESFITRTISNRQHLQSHIHIVPV